MRSFVTILFLGAALLLNSCQQKQVAREDVVQTLDSLEVKTEWLNYRIMYETWELYTTGQSDSLDILNAIYGEITANQETFNILKNGKKFLDDDIDLRRWEMMFSTMLNGRVESDPNIVKLRDSLTRVDLAFSPEFEDTTYNRNELYTLYHNEADPTRRELAYRAWVSSGDVLAEGLERLFRMRNQLARKQGYNNYFKLRFSQMEVDEATYLGLLSSLDEASAEPYRELLERIRVKLGVPQIDIWDIGYAYRDVTGQIDAYFPIDSQLHFIKETLKAMDIDLDKMPIYFDLEQRPGKSQYAYAFPVKPPHDLRVLANLTPGLQSIRTLCHEIGHVLHSGMSNQDRPMFNRYLDGAWTEAIAQIFAGITYQKEWLTSTGHVPPELVDEYLQVRREEELIYLRQRLTRLMFEYEAYKNPSRDLNELYWDMSDRYTFLPRHEEMKSWASVVHFMTHPIYLPNYLYADIVTAQTQDYILNHSSYAYVSPSTKAFLVQNYIRFGGRYPWTELLERGTGESLNPDYYAKRMGL